MSSLEFVNRRNERVKFQTLYKCPKCHVVLSDLIDVADHTCEEKKTLTVQDYIGALEIQNACNLSGIVKSFSRVIDKIWDEARDRGVGTTFVNEHPITKLYVDKLADLAKVREMPQFTAAFDAVLAKIRETEPDYQP